MYFHTTHPNTIDFIARVAVLAKDNGQRLRIDVDSEGNLRIKRGEGVWSAPIPSTPDPYRDGKVTCNRECATTPENMHPDTQHYLGCRIWNIHTDMAWSKHNA